MHAAKRAALEQKIKRYTEAKSATRDAARAALIDEGIYTRDGKLAPGFGGSLDESRLVRKQ